MLSLIGAAPTAFSFAPAQPLQQVSRYHAHQQCLQWCIWGRGKVLSRVGARRFQGAELRHTGVVLPVPKRYHIGAPLCAIVRAYAHQFRQCSSCLRTSQAARCSGLAMVTNPSNALPFLTAPASQSSGLPGAETGFDPLYIGDFMDLKWMREAELKHGRICMMCASPDARSI